MEDKPGAGLPGIIIHCSIHYSEILTSNSEKWGRRHHENINKYKFQSTQKPKWLPKIQIKNLDNHKTKKKLCKYDMDATLMSDKSGPLSLICK